MWIESQNTGELLNRDLIERFLVDSSAGGTFAPYAILTGSTTQHRVTAELYPTTDEATAAMWAVAAGLAPPEPSS